MRFLVDNQLPPQLARHLSGRGHDALHVADVQLESADDQALWDWAIQEHRVLISKDEDFLFLANRQGDSGSLLWIRLGNCRTVALIAAFDQALPGVIEAFESGQRVIELS